MRQIQPVHSNGVCTPRIFWRGVLCILSTLLFLPRLVESRPWWVCQNTPAYNAVPSTASPLPLVDWPKIAQRALPAVVSITSATAGMSQPAGQLNPMVAEPSIRSTFQGRPHSIRRGRNIGSGVLISADGYVLTTYHVIEGAEDIRVVLADRRKLQPQVVGIDPLTDLAVLKLPGADFPALQLGDSAHVAVAEPVLAIGNPFGLNQTVTMGVVSAVGRVHLGVTDYEEYIQTDATINPGNSGGALINACGELIGINTALFSTTGNYMGIGFAVPANVARTIFEQIRTQGHVSRGRLGIVVQELTPSLARGLGVPEIPGLLISDVSLGGPAERAGLRQDDVLVRYQHTPVESSGHFRNLVAQSLPGSKLPVAVYREGRELNLEIIIGERPHEQSFEESVGHEVERLGLDLVNLDLGIAKKLGLPLATQGVVVVEVFPGSPAEMAGLQSGDVIREVNRKPIHSASDFEANLEKVMGLPLVLFVNREGSNLYVVLERRE